MTIKYEVQIRASKAGSIGEKYYIARSYTVETEFTDWEQARDDLNTKAIKRAYDEGLEHVLVTHYAKLGG